MCLRLINLNHFLESDCNVKILNYLKKYLHGVLLFTRIALFCNRKTRTKVVQDAEPQITMTYLNLGSMSEV